MSFPLSLLRESIEEFPGSCHGDTRRATKGIASDQTFQATRKVAAASQQRSREEMLHAIILTSTLFYVETPNFIWLKKN